MFDLELIFKIISNYAFCIIIINNKPTVEHHVDDSASKNIKRVLLLCFGSMRVWLALFFAITSPFFGNPRLKPKMSETAWKKALQQKTEVWDQ